MRMSSWPIKWQEKIQNGPEKKMGRPYVEVEGVEVSYILFRLQPLSADNQPTRDLQEN